MPPEHGIHPRSITNLFLTLGVSLLAGENGVGYLPGLRGVDIRMIESRRSETKQLELRFEAFNAFNRAQFTNPTGEINSSQFGVVTNARAARIIQWGEIPVLIGRALKPTDDVS
jgi:hypothetical protein